jgi:hypothetical protein
LGGFPRLAEAGSIHRLSDWKAKLP